MDFNWLGVNVSTNLTWTSCYESFQCARLTVPLIYSNHSAGEAQVALVMSPSNFSAGDSNYLGPILFNPGGPGESGVELIVEGAEYFREIVGPQYDLVGFDPRGVGVTTPALSIFRDPAEALQWYATWPLNVNESASSFGRAFAQSTILGRLAEDRAEEVAESVSTPTVANDMLSITKAFGFDKVNYWGISYGSVLGATFAAMFPDNVGRFVIDGVVNSHEWYEGVDTSSLVDADAALHSVWAACVAAGPDACALYENSTAHVAARVQVLVDRVHLAPVPVINDTDPSAITFAVVDYAALVDQLFLLAYFPYSHAPAAAAALAALERGDGGPILQGSQLSGIDGLSTCAYDSSEPYVAGLLEVELAIACGDQRRVGAATLDRAKANYQDLVKQSRFFAGDLWATLQAGCTGWTIRGKDRFNASFATNTSTPLLIIGNTLDPITPLVSAKNMSHGFAGSVLLQQNSTGHSSWSGFSTCTARAVNAYFTQGALPAPGTVCQPDFAIFEDAGAPTSLVRRGASRVYEAAEVLQRHMLRRARARGARRAGLR